MNSYVIAGETKALTNEADVPWLPHVPGLTVGFQAHPLLLFCSSGRWLIYYLMAGERRG